MKLTKLYTLAMRAPRPMAAVIDSIDSSPDGVTLTLQSLPGAAAPKRMTITLAAHEAAELADGLWAAIRLLPAPRLESPKSAALAMTGPIAPIAPIAAVKAAVVAHRSMPESEYQMHCEEDNGYCLACGEIRWGCCEPDARDYECESCGECKVMAFEEALISGHISFVGE